MTDVGQIALTYSSTVPPRASPQNSSLSTNVRLFNLHGKCTDDISFTKRSNSRASHNVLKQQQYYEVTHLIVSRSTQVEDPMLLAS